MDDPEIEAKALLRRARPWPAPADRAAAMAAGTKMTSAQGQPISRSASAR